MPVKLYPRALSLRSGELQLGPWETQPDGESCRQSSYLAAATTQESLSSWTAMS